MEMLQRNSDELVKTWTKNCQDNSLMHDMARAYFKKYNMFTMIPAILLASISGVSLVGFASKTHDDNNNNINYFISIMFGVCSILSGSLISINRLLRYPELQEQHDIYSDSFEILHHEIDLQRVIMDTDDSVFKNRFEFMKYVKHRIDIIIDKAPPIPGTIRSKYDRIKGVGLGGVGVGLGGLGVGGVGLGGVGVGGVGGGPSVTIEIDQSTPRLINS
jgi:hypothetical protein